MRFFFLRLKASKFIPNGSSQSLRKIDKKKSKKKNIKDVTVLQGMKSYLLFLLLLLWRPETCSKLCEGFSVPCGFCCIEFWYFQLTYSVFKPHFFPLFLRDISLWCAEKVLLLFFLVNVFPITVAIWYESVLGPVYKYIYIYI